MSKEHISQKIAQLDPENDHQEIVRLLSQHIFPWDFERAAEFALFRTYAVPSISGLLAETGEFVARPQKRYDDTELIMYELSDHGYDSERGRQAMRRMNQMHGRYDISNEDMLYVLTTFIYEPIRWVEKYGRRPLTAEEKQALFRYYREVGRRMNIKDIPDDYDLFDQFNRQYETDHFRYAESNRIIGETTIKLFLSFYLYKPLWPLGRPIMYAMMDEPLLDAFGYPHPPSWLRKFVTGGLKLRARILRLFPERRQPVIGSRRLRPTYPNGHNVDQLGTFQGK